MFKQSRIMPVNVYFTFRRFQTQQTEYSGYYLADGKFEMISARSIFAVHKNSRNF